MELKTHRKIINFFGWVIPISLLLQGISLMTGIWYYYGIFWIGTILLFIDLFLGFIAEYNLDRLIEEEENPYEE